MYISENHDSELVVDALEHIGSEMNPIDVNSPGQDQ
jgi:hypothetical protein